MINFQNKSAIELSIEIRNKEINVQELIRATIKNINEQNQTLNAVISLREEKALIEAADLKDTGQPFYGVPLLLKGLGQQLAGESDTGGNKLLKSSVAEHSNNFVKSLQAAGFIIIGQTNFPEFGFKNITDSKLYGSARNPWDTSYSPGGSSGGAGAAVASGMVPIAAGSDGGGSIRIPASWSGVVGLKPTRGRVPVGPDDWRSWQGASTSFALTNNINDTAMLLNQIQVVQSAAVFQTPKIDLSQLDNWDKSIKIGYTTKSPVGTPVSDDAVIAVQQAVEFLEHQGFAVEEIDIPINGIEVMESHYLMNAGETSAMFAGMSSAMGRSIRRDEMERLTWALYQTGNRVKAAEYIDALNLWDQTAYKMDLLHDKYPLVLTPTTAFTAPKVNDPLVSPEDYEKMYHINEMSSKQQREFIYEQWLPALTRSPFTQTANLTGEPAISLPTYVSGDGLPLGIQFTAAKGREDLLLQMGKLFEVNQQFKLLSN